MAQAEAAGTAITAVLLSCEAPHALLLELTNQWTAGAGDYNVDDVDDDDNNNDDDKDMELQGGSLEEMRFLYTDRSTTATATTTASDKEELLRFQGAVEQFEQLLTPLSDFLASFNKQLTALSGELERLKDQALALSTNLDRTRELEQRYTPVVGDLAVAPEVVRQLYNGAVDSGSWCEALAVLEDKQLMLAKYAAEHRDVHAATQLQQLLAALNTRALERIKMFLVSRIKQLRQVGTPSQCVQRELLRVKDAFVFLERQQPALALELKQAYVYTMRWYYRAHFARYKASLDKLHVRQYDRAALIGGVQTYFHAQQQHMEYTIGKRGSVVTAEDPTVMLAQIAEHNPTTAHMEVGFRSFNLALCDNASVEYLFMSEFFGGNVNAQLEQIFDPTYQLGSSYTKSLISTTYDIFGVLILIRLSQSLIFELQKRRIPVIEDYLNLQMILLWPRFQQLVDLNCENMKRSSARSSSITAISSGKPHPLTVQFTNLIYGFHQLTHKDTQTTQEPLSQSIQRLRNDYESIMTRMAKSSKQGELFLYTNYSHVLSVLGECEASSEREHFETLVRAFEPK